MAQAWPYSSTCRARSPTDKLTLRIGLHGAGPISARLYAASSGTNLNLIASLYDVGPDGTATKLSSGSIVGSLRRLDRSRSWFDKYGMNIRPYGRYAADEYLVPEQNYELTFRILPRVAQLAPGHAVRLTITTQTPATDCAGVLGTDPCYPTAPQSLTLPGTYEVQVFNNNPSAIGYRLTLNPPA